MNGEPAEKPYPLPPDQFHKKAIAPKPMIVGNPIWSSFQRARVRLLEIPKCETTKLLCPPASARKDGEESPSRIVVNRIIVDGNVCVCVCLERGTKLDK